MFTYQAHKQNSARTSYSKWSSEDSNRRKVSRSMTNL